MRRNPRLPAICLLIASTVLLIACGNNQVKNGQSRLSLVAVNAKPVSDWYTFQSTLEAKNEVKLSSQVVGRIKTIDVQEGSRVNKDQLLYTLDQTNARELLEAQQAKAQLDAIYARKYEYLRQRGVISQTVRDEYHTKAASSEALQKALKAALDYRVITSPMNGIVSSIDIKVGNVAEIGEPIFSIIDNSLLEARVNVPLSLSSVIKINQPVYLESKEGSHQVLRGRINFISPLADRSTQTFLVKALFENASGELRHHENITIKIKGPSRRRLLIPDQSIFRNSGQAFVFKAVSLEEAQNLLKRRVKIPKGFTGLISVQTPIEVVALGNGYSEVTSGLQDGNQIVAKNPGLISNGALIH